MSEIEKVSKNTDKDMYPVIFRAEHGRINENLEGLEKWLESQMEPYKGFSLTESNLKEAKAIKAKLNKVKEQLEDERKKLHAEYEKEYDNFFSRYKKALSSITEFITKLSGEIKEAEEAAKALRWENLINFVKESAKDIGGEAFVAKIEKPEVLAWFIDARWLHTSTSSLLIQREVREKLTRVKSDFDCLAKDAPDPVAYDAYYTTGSLSAAFEEKRKIDALRTEIQSKEETHGEEPVTTQPVPEQQQDEKRESDIPDDGDFTFDGEVMKFTLPRNITAEKSKIVKLRPITLTGPKWALIFVKKVIYPALGIEIEKKEGETK